MKHLFEQPFYLYDSITTGWAIVIALIIVSVFGTVIRKAVTYKPR